MKTTPFFGFAAKPRPHRRILMQFIDAGPGEPNWAKFECRKCKHLVETFTASNADLRRGIPCPICNQP